MRDIQRKTDSSNDPELDALLSQAARLLKQEKNTPKKLYSLHAPETECIAKGKAHKRYELVAKYQL
jgi:IS5 family transposase